ncbi:hypothetical protein [Micromonospora sp. WMMD975]|uniref:hypothetical protein n=1 Tax=Micromonospora sp. WMMD975 TaxID=3016087 RepID=UPI002499B194|nr:hypothetical protein [Micromonospora sp. WMMD975]WFE34684.1 hypothetical protein O7613_04675 [Micromonospora sp. WMMD975]
MRAPRRTGRRSRAAPASLPTPHPRSALTLALLFSTALLVCLYLAGDGVVKVPRWAPHQVWPALTDGVRGVLAGARIMFFAAGPLRWRQLGLLGLGLLTYVAWRSWRQASFADRPGPIDIRKFENGTEEKEGCATYLRSRFCRQLADTDIYPPYAGPSDPAPQGFMDALSKQGDTSSPMQVITRVVAALWPRNGYFVTATLQKRTQEPQYGLSVTVTSLLGRAQSTTTTMWGRSWEDATCRAAYWTMAKILPATRLAKNPPWRKWYGRDMPAELFECYNEAKKRHDDQKLDDALWWYREALRLDPFNINIRMMVASVQEDLGLFLDALHTYEAALAVVELEGRYTGALWSRRRYRLVRPWRFTWSTLRLLRRHPEWIRLRYQYARALGYTERLVGEWFADEPSDDRRTERHRVHDQVRQRLCAALADRYWPAVANRTTLATEEQAKDHVRVLLTKESSARTLLALAAWQEFHRLHDDAALARLVPAVDREIGRRLLRAMRDLWAPLRLMSALNDDRRGAAGTAMSGERPGADAPLERVEFDVRDAECLPTWWHRHHRVKARQALVIGWPADPRALEQRIWWVQRRWNWFGPMNHLDYYTAACVAAFALAGYPRKLPDRDPDERRCGLPRANPRGEVELLTHLAVDNLRAALQSTESGRAGRVVTQSDTRYGTASRLRTWILSSDSDLAWLRHHAVFRFFEQDIYQSLQPVSLRPMDVTKVRVASYVKQLLCEGARLLEREWHKRRLQPGQRPSFLHDVLRWVRLDRQTWQVVERIGRDHGLHWEDRAKFGRLVTEAVRLVRTAELHFPPAVPRYDDLDLPQVSRIDDDEPYLANMVEDRVHSSVSRVNACLDQLGHAMAGAFEGEADDEDRVLRVLDVADHDLATAYAEFCMRHARRWQWVIEVLDDADLDVETVVPDEEQIEP